MEVLVAAVILAIALIPMIQMFSTGGRFNTGAGKVSAAMDLAQGKLEEIKETPFKDVVTVGTKQPFPAPYDNYKYQLAVTESDNRKTVTVSVYYQEYEVEKHVSLTMDKVKR